MIFWLQIIIWFLFHILFFIVVALSSGGNWCYINFRWSSVVTIKKIIHLQGILTGECNFSLSCSTIVSMYRYKNSGNSSALEIWQTKLPAQNLLFDLSKTVQHFMVSVPVKSETYMWFLEPAKHLYSLCCPYVDLEFFTYFPTSPPIYMTIAHFLHEAFSDQTFVSFMVSTTTIAPVPMSIILLILLYFNWLLMCLTC